MSDIASIIVVETSGSLGWTRNHSVKSSLVAQHSEYNLLAIASSPMPLTAVKDPRTMQLSVQTFES